MTAPLDNEKANHKRMNNLELLPLRREIDAIDDELVVLLNKRADLVVRLPEIKERASLPLIDDDREKEVLVRVARLAAGPFDHKAIMRIFSTIIRECRGVQRQRLAKDGTSQREST